MFKYYYRDFELLKPSRGLFVSIHILSKKCDMIIFVFDFDVIQTKQSTSKGTFYRFLF